MFTLLVSFVSPIVLVVALTLGAWCYDDEKITRESWRRARPVMESLLISTGAVLVVIAFGVTHHYGRMPRMYFEYVALHLGLMVGVATYQIVWPIMKRRAMRDIKIPLARQFAAEDQGVRWTAYTDQLSMKLRDRKKKRSQ